MKIIRSIREMRDFASDAVRSGKVVGLVPTMGSLHEGHLSLVKASIKECDITVLSVFVNPSQFGTGEDLEKYPRDIQKDSGLAEKEGVDVMFVPSEQEMYPEGYSTYVQVTGSLTDGLCGASRPGHFRGVATVVCKLFNIVLPHKSYFGIKDAQQAAVIKKMAGDLDYPAEIRVLPVVREKDGLAMSSRNVYLTQEERKKALLIPKALKRASDMAESGVTSAEKIKKEIEDILMADNGPRIDYVEIVDPATLDPVESTIGGALIAVAVYVGSTRLIDNVVISERTQHGGNE